MYVVVTVVDDDDDDGDDDVNGIPIVSVDIVVKNKK